MYVNINAVDFDVNVYILLRVQQ